MTGSRGWIGSLAADVLCGRGHEVAPYDLRDRQDIHDAEALREALAGCEAVAHLAAIPHPAPEHEWEDYWWANVVGTQAVAEAAVGAGVRRLVYTSSTSYYGAQRGFPLRARRLREDSPNGLQRCLGRPMPDMADPYNRAAVGYMCSKIAAEACLGAYALSRRLEVVVLRLAPVTLDGVPWLWGLVTSRERAAWAVVGAVEVGITGGYAVYNVADPDVAMVDSGRAAALEVGDALADS